MDGGFIRMKEYDAAIIGAGIGGLMCGALLAHRGYKVLIFEKNAFLGGCCSSFVRGGFTFDACVHWFSGCGPGSFIDKLFRKIGIELPFIKYVPMDCFHFADRTVIVPEKIEEYQELLIKNYPAEEAGIKAFFQEMEHNNELLFSLVMDFGKARDLYANEKILNQTFQEVLDKFIKSN
jgi:phytoene dehydrogenase-like protein